MANLVTKGHAIAGKLSVGTGGAALNGAVTINENGGDYDFRVEADSNTNALNVDAGLFGGAGAVGIGSAAVNKGTLVVDPPAMSAVASTNYARLRVSNTNAVTVPAGTTNIAASVIVNEPNFTATGTVTNAASVYIDGAPTEGTNNNALWVDGGTCRFDSGVTINEDGEDSDTRIEADSNTNALNVDAGLFTGVGAVGLLAAATDAASVLVNPPAMSATAATNYAKMHIDNGAAVTIPTGTTALVAALRVDEPNLTATGTITTAATVYIEAAPTEAGTNHALFVDAGSTRLDGQVYLRSATEPVKKIAATTEATAGAVTYTIAQMLGGLILRDCNGAGRSDVTPTAALIVAGITGAAVDDTFETWIVNTSDAAETITVTAGTGVTLIPATITIAQNENAKLLVRLTNVTGASEAVTMYAVVAGG